MSARIESLPPVVRQKIATQCADFESAWLSGLRPKLPEFLLDLDESARETLLSELLAIELSHVADDEASQRRSEYQTLFPKSAQAIANAFQQRAAQTAVPGLQQATLVPGAAETIVQTAPPDVPPRIAVAAPPSAPETVIPAVAPVKVSASATTQRGADETLNETDRDQMQTMGEDPTTPVSATRRTGPTRTAAGVRLIPKVLGDYELLEELGKGGMGIVFRARQRRANRIVALKIIRPDRLGGLSIASQNGIIERFRKEAQAAARLQHDNMVTVFEVGEIDGCHYFSMQYVEGSSLADWLRNGPLDCRQAAQFVEPICRAVHAAHLVGVLHRDIKPQNIMIEKDVLRPRIADFGLAKLADDEVQQTQSGEMMGTPPYMPPEQFGNAVHCTAKADLYSLGATLYHSLSGRPPFQAATSIATMRQVLDQEPVPLRQLNPAVDVELETLCMKCLEKEPERRLASAEALADELRRYLNGEPILSQPISRMQRLRRWSRRNPVVASLIVAVAASLLIAMGALAFTAVKTEKARQVVEQSLGETKVAQVLSEASFQDALSAVNEFFTRVSEDRLLNEPGAQGLRKELLELAKSYYSRLLDRRKDDPTVQEELAASHYRMGLILEELESPEAGIKSYETARAMLGVQLTKHPDSKSRQQFLSNTLNALGRAKTRLGKLDEAEQLFKESQRIRATLVSTTENAGERLEFDRLLANTGMNLALIQKQRGNLDEAKRLMTQSQEDRAAVLPVRPKDRKLRRDLAKGDYNLANLGVDQDDAGAVEKHVRLAIKRFEELLTETPDDIEDRNLLAQSYRLLADLDAALAPSDDKRLIEAIHNYSQSRAAFEKLVARNPAVPRYRIEVARLLANLAELESERSRSDEAKKLLDRAEEILEALLKDQPGERECLELLKKVHAFRAKP